MGRSDPPQSPQARISELLENERSWLYKSELEILQSFARQSNAGRHLSDKQRTVLRKIAARCAKRHTPRFMSGGGPGTGKRR